jgi:predicted amidohydrolase
MDIRNSMVRRATTRSPASGRTDGNANHRKLQLPSDYERENFMRGGRLTLLDLAGWKAALLVCYDVEFPEAVRACALGGAELVVVPTALRDRWGFVANTMIPTRAFENGVFLLYANYAGSEGDWNYLGASCAIGPDGSEIARAGEGCCAACSTRRDRAGPDLSPDHAYWDDDGVAEEDRATSRPARRMPYDR